MTNEEAKSELMQIYMSLSEEKKQALDVLMAQAEKTCDIEKSNFDVRQYKLDTDTAYECGYNAGLQAQADGEYISRQAVLASIKNLYPDMPIADIFGARRKWLEKYAPYFECENAVEQLPSVNPPKPKTGHWIEEDMFDGDVAYRCSECNELFWIEDGTPKDNGYDFCPKCGARMVEPQESEEQT